MFGQTGPRRASIWRPGTHIYSYRGVSCSFVLAEKIFLLMAMGAEGHEEATRGGPTTNLVVPDNYVACTLLTAVTAIY